MNNRLYGWIFLSILVRGVSGFLVIRTGGCSLRNRSFLKRALSCFLGDYIGQVVGADLPVRTVLFPSDYIGHRWLGQILPVRTVWWLDG